MRPASLLRFVAATFAPLLTGCGGGVTDGSPDASAGDTAPPDAGWTQCSSPQGFAVCGIPACAVPENSLTCKCGAVLCGGDAGVGICFNEATNRNGDAQLCGDGQIYASTSSCSTQFGDAGRASKVYYSFPYEVGQLEAMNGGADNVRYADYGTWTGDPLPEPSNCPTLDKIPICGGKCGGCPTGQICTGRSPLHPYGFCVAHATTMQCAPTAVGCNADQGCFTFKVQPEAQAGADRGGMCVPLDECNALAANLPGGGTCTPH